MLLIIKICSWCKQTGFAFSKDLQFGCGIDWRRLFLCSEGTWRLSCELRAACSNCMSMWEVINIVRKKSFCSGGFWFWKGKKKVFLILRPCVLLFSLMPFWLAKTPLTAATCFLLGWVSQVVLSSISEKRPPLYAMCVRFSAALLPCSASFVVFVLRLFVCFPAWAILWSEYSSLTFYPPTPPLLQIELPPCVWLISYSFSEAIQLLVGLWWSGPRTQQHNVAIEHQQASKKRNQNAAVCAVTRHCSHRHQ